MITLHILQLLQDEGFGTIDTDMFWEEMPVDQTGGNIDGLWIISRGDPIARGRRTSQTFDIYTRYKNKITGSLQLHNILKYFNENYVQCTLPSTEGSDLVFEDVTIEPSANIENAGIDDNGKVIRVISGQVIYRETS